MFSVRTTAFEKATTSESASAAVEPVSSEDLAVAQVVTYLPSPTRQQKKVKGWLQCLRAHRQHMACLDDVYVRIASLHHSCMSGGMHNQLSARECTLTSLTICCAGHLH